MTNTLLRHRPWVLGAFIVVLALLLGGTLRLAFNPDARVFFGEHNPERLTLEELEATYTSGRNVLFVIHAGTGDLFTPRHLAAIAEMTDEAWLLPYALRVDSLTNFNHSYAEGDEIIIEPLFDPAADGSEPDRVRSIALGEPDLVHRLISPDGKTTAINVVVVKSDDPRAAVREIARAARAFKASWQARYPDLEFRLSGGVLADMTFAEAAQRDIATLVPLMGLLTFAALMIGLKSMSATLATAIIIFASAGAAFGFAGWSGMILNGATSGAPVSIMVLGIASCVHILLTWLQRQADGYSGHAALLESIRVNAGPIVVTNVTTAIGFLCLNFAASPPLRDLGNIIAFGVLFGMVLQLTVLPVLISYIPTHRSFRAYRFIRCMHWLANKVIRYRRWLIGLLPVMLILAGWGISRIVLDDDFVGYFGESFEFRQDTDFLEQHLSGLNVLQFSLPSGAPGGIFEPDFLEQVDRFTDWLGQQSNVVYVYSIVNMLKRVNANMHGDDPAYYRIASTPEHNAQYLLLYELSLPVGHDLNSLIDVDRSRLMVIAVLRGVSSQNIRHLGFAAEQWLIDHTPTMQTPATGLSIVFAYVSERNIRSMIWGTLLALILISSILLFTLRSIRFGIISLAPNLFPVIFAFGLWGFLMVNVNLASSVVTAMTLGIVVDDTVHFLMKYLRARRSEGLSPEAAIHRVFGTVGIALILSSAALVLGFLVLATSDFAINQHVGLLCAITILTALAADLLFLPALLLGLDNKEAP